MKYFDDPVGSGLDSVRGVDQVRPQCQCGRRTDVAAVVKQGLVRKAVITFELKSHIGILESVR